MFRNASKYKTLRKSPTQLSEFFRKSSSFGAITDSQLGISPTISFLFYAATGAAFGAGNLYGKHATAMKINAAAPDISQNSVSKP